MSRIKWVALIAVVLLVGFAYVEGATLIKSIRILNGMFSNAESSYFQVSTPEVIVLDNQTKLYIFKPASNEKHPAMIFSLGLWENGTDPRLQKPVETLVNNGFVVELVESNDTASGYLTNNSVNSLVKGFTYMENQDYVQKDKIGFFGISVGASVAYVASANPGIRDDVLFIFWLGGYYDGMEYVTDVFSDSTVHNGKIIEYHADQKVKNALLTMGIIDEETAGRLAPTKDREEIRALLESSSAIKERISAISPSNYEVEVKIFAVHDVNDSYVPFTQSIRLVEEREVDAHVQTELVRHAVPKVDVELFQFLKEYVKLVFLTNGVLKLTEN
ncbi:MAG: hypothetical protein HYT70_03445 [Candidatus Aenigmarchaeota archaeon]|nr:hypothetical protein [Candidatus Aenigmarchaeota archaeon]